ncbi:MAG: NfeD-like protein [Cyanobacteriota bacterium]|nr:NfeD-like protein [Cyanobacteriota bacterium]
MLSVYLFCTLVGGLLVALSAFGGLDGVEFDQDFDADLEFRDAPEGKGQIRVKPKSSKGRFWLPFFSMKFWTFGTCFFGLAGLFLWAVKPTMMPAISIAISLAFGIFCGTSMASAMRVLKEAKVDSLVRTSDLIGLSGMVELPFDKNSRGKVLLNVKGSMVAFGAFTEENKEFAVGEKAFVVGMENNKLWVISEEAIAPKDETD